MIIATFLFFTILVAVLTWWVTRNSTTDTDEGYFLAGRSLTGIFIAGSLLLTNLSTEQLIGLNAGAFNEGLSVMAWEVVAGFSLVVLALFFLPRYLKSGIATIPQFLDERYGSVVRTMATVIFIVAYTFILLPFVLYLGARGLSGMLDLETLLGFRPANLSQLTGKALEDATQTMELKTIWSVIIFIAVVGGAYAIWGGLKAVAVSDTFNGAGLLIGGLMITGFSLATIMESGESVFDVFNKIKTHDPDSFQSMGTMQEDVSWPTLFTGVLLLNFFYWCTNQQIIQRTFGAKNLAEGQKGVLLAAFFKILAPTILVLPGIIAAYLVAHDTAFADAVGGKGEKAFGALVSRVLPEWLVGFFAAVVVGSILSTFNSVLNSSATLFSLDVFKKIFPGATMKQVVWSGQICSFLVAVFAVIAAPNFFYNREAIFGFFQKLNGVYFIPLLAIILVGVFNKRVNGWSAVVSLLLGLVLMSIGTFVPGTEVIKDGKTFSAGWLQDYFLSSYHYMGAVFAMLVVVQLILGMTIMKRNAPYEQPDAKIVDLTPWKPAPIVGGLLIALAVGIYVFFSR